MKFNEYVKMKNFSEQQNFALKVPFTFDKAAMAANKEYLKSLGIKGKDAIAKLMNSGAADLAKAKEVKDSKSLFTNLLRKVKGKPSVEKEAKKLKLIGNAKNIAGKAAVLGTAAGIISIAALVASDKFDESKYYIFDEESQVILGSKNGYKTKTEALKVRDEDYPGERINVGKTLRMKAKQANFSEQQNFTNPFGYVKKVIKGYKDKSAAFKNAHEASKASRIADRNWVKADKELEKLEAARTPIIKRLDKANELDVKAINANSKAKSDRYNKLVHSQFEDPMYLKLARHHADELHKAMNVASEARKNAYKNALSKESKLYDLIHLG